MTRLFHIVGRQGVGKSTVAQAIARGLAHLDVQCPAADETRGLSPAQVRRQYAGADIVLVEAQQLGPQHVALPPGDLLIQLSAGVVHPTVSQETRDAA